MPLQGTAKLQLPSHKALAAKTPCEIFVGTLAKTASLWGQPPISAIYQAIIILG
jgi:hypothetical protein